MSQRKMSLCISVAGSLVVFGATDERSGAELTEVELVEWTTEIIPPNIYIVAETHDRRVVGFSVPDDLRVDRQDADGVVIDTPVLAGDLPYLEGIAAGVVAYVK